MYYTGVIADQKGTMTLLLILAALAAYAALVLAPVSATIARLIRDQR